jgi:translin
MTLSRLLRDARADFRAWDKRREALLAGGRELTRLAGQLIQSYHRHDARPADWLRLERLAAKILVDIQKAPAFRHAGFVQQALGEYVEAILLANPRNATSKLAKIPGDALVLGVADAIGELRRVVLTHLLADDVKTARQALDQMERLFAALTDVEAPEPLVPVRAKRDQARGILERTRSDLVTAKKSKDLETKIDRLGDLLDEAEGRPKKKSKKPNADDLDLDGAWSRS